MRGPQRIPKSLQRGPKVRAKPYVAAFLPLPCERSSSDGAAPPGGSVAQNRGPRALPQHDGPRTGCISPRIWKTMMKTFRPMIVNLLCHFKGLKVVGTAREFHDCTRVDLATANGP